MLTMVGDTHGPGTTYRTQADVRLVVDVANVLGSRPDGWWRDRVGATSRLLAELATLVGVSVEGPDGVLVRIAVIETVVEGRAAAAEEPVIDGMPVEGLHVVRAPADGDTTIAARAGEAVGETVATIVVTADRGLRDQLPDTCRVAGPRWLLSLLGGPAG
jgi:hypothetical protein